MDEDEDDIYYASPPGDVNNERHRGNSHLDQTVTTATGNEGNGKDDDSDSDIDIITERASSLKSESLQRDQTRPKHTQLGQEQTVAKVQQPKSISAEKNGAGNLTQRQNPIQPQKPGTDYPGVHTSTINVDNQPIYEPIGKQISTVNIDADLIEHDKPWRRPGQDQSDYFNYGFDEFTWTAYCLKQGKVRKEIEAQKAEQTQFETFLGVGGPGAGLGQGQSNMPGMGGMAAMPGMPDMNHEMMQNMMQSMMAGGQDPTQMDFGQFVQQMQSMQGGMGSGAGPGVGSALGSGRSQGGFSGSRGRGRRW